MVISWGGDPYDLEWVEKHQAEEEARRKAKEEQESE